MASPLDFFQVIVGYRNLLQGPSNWEQIEQRLRKYSLGEVLEKLGQISAVLNRFEKKFERSLSDQLYICRHLFGAQADEIWSRFLASRVEEDPATVMFAEQQLVNAAKAALILLEPGHASVPNRRLNELGEALLMINDLISDQSAPQEIRDESLAEQVKWHQYFVSNRLFHRGGRWFDNMVRSYDLYLTDRAHLKCASDYLDLPRLAESVTGLTPDELWAAIFALVSHWSNANVGQNSIPVRLNIRDYLSKYDLEPEKFFGFAVSPLEQVQQQVRQRYTGAALQPFDALPLAKSPVLQMGDDCYCLSVKLLAEKLTVGLYHLFLRDEVDSATKDRFLTYLGRVVQDYVDSLLFRVYPPASSRYLSETELRKLIPEGKICDGIILYGDSLILLEVKATVYSLGVYAATSWSEYESKTADIFYDSAGQFHETIDAIAAGRLVCAGIDPKRVNSYFPVVVTLEDTGMMQLFYDKISKEIASRGLLQQAQTRPFQNLTLAELDRLEADIAGGRCLLDLIRDKALSEQWRGESLRNYCYAERTDWMKQENPRLKELGDRLFQRGIDALKRHEQQP